MDKITVIEGNLAHSTLGIDPLLKVKVIQDTEIFIHAAGNLFPCHGSLTVSDLFPFASSL